MSKIYAFDLDDTLCIRQKGVEELGAEKYKYCTPIPEMVQRVNQLYNEGNTILIYTARGMNQFQNNLNKIYNELYVLTLDSLKEWGIKHHGLIMGKLHYDYLVDDKVINVVDFEKHIEKETEYILEHNRIKKVAICLSGEVRTWKDTIESWKNIIGFDDVEIDYFFHAWDSVNPPSTFYVNKRKELGVDLEELEKTYQRKITKEEMDEIVDKIKPKKFIFEPSRKFIPKNEKQTVQLSHAISQFYSTMVAGRLKKQYEIENNFMYDLVIKSRFDLFFYKPIIKKQNKIEPHTVFGNHYKFITDGKFLGRLGDIIWYSDSITYDILTNFYFDLPNISSDLLKENLPPEYSWFHYINKNNIKIKLNKDWLLKTYRGNPDFIVDKDGNYEI